MAESSVFGLGFQLGVGQHLRLHVLDFFVRQAQAEGIWFSVDC